MRRLSTTETLEAILQHPVGASVLGDIRVEAEAAWFPKSGGDVTEGEAQAIIKIAERRFAISLEPLT